MLQNYSIDQARIVLEVEIQLQSKKKTTLKHMYFTSIFLGILGS